MNPNITDYNDRTALHLAAANGHLGIVKYLCSHSLTKKSMVDNMGATPLNDAIRHNHRDVQIFLRSKNANLEDACIGFKLCHAAANNNLETIEVSLLALDVAQNIYWELSVIFI